MDVLKCRIWQEVITYLLYETCSWQRALMQCEREVAAYAKNIFEDFIKNAGPTQLMSCFLSFTPLGFKEMHDKTIKKPRCTWDSARHVANTIYSLGSQ